MGEHTELYELVQRCCTADDFAWGVCTLADDALFPRFHAGQIQDIVNTATECGLRVARAFLNQYPGAAPIDIARDKGVPVLERDYNPDGKSKMIFFGQFIDGRICVPSDTVRVIRQQVCEHGLTALLGEFDISSMIVAHELFHHYESEHPEIETRAMKVPIQTLKLFRQNVTPLFASEIAAFAFSKELTHVHFHPRTLEVIGVYPLRPDLSLQLVQRIEKYASASHI